ncbi:MAG TPA: porin, partial [Roseomonas sp.]
AGAFQPQHLPEYASSSFDLPFMERAAISNIVASLASGSTRIAAGAEANGAIGGNGARWNASGYVTGGVASTPHDNRQRGLAGRAVVLAVGRPDLQLQIGADIAAQFHPGTNPGPETVRLRDYPELRVDTRRFLDSGTIRADSAWAAGPEFAGRLGPLYVEAVWQRVTIDATAGGERRYDGWYVEGAYPLLGKPRERADRTATWKRPMPEDGRGALELAARYSTVDLRDGMRGARQSIWTVGLTWYPTEELRLGVQYEKGTIGLSGPDRDFQAIGLRAAFNL